MEEKSLLDSVNVRPPHGMARHINGKMMIWDAISVGVIWWEQSHWQFSHFCLFPFPSVATFAVTWQKRGKLHGVQPQSLWARGTPSGELITIVWFQTRLPNFLGTSYSPWSYLLAQKKGISTNCLSPIVFATLCFVKKRLWQFTNGQSDRLLEKVYYWLDPPWSESVSRKRPRSAQNFSL